VRIRPLSCACGNPLVSPMGIGGLVVGHGPLLEVSIFVVMISATCLHEQMLPVLALATFMLSPRRTSLVKQSR